MPGPTEEELDAKRDEKKAAAADSAAKKEQAHIDTEAAEAAVVQARESRKAYREALIVEHRIEDELEQMQLEHEPDEVPPEETT